MVTVLRCVLLFCTALLAPLAHAVTVLENALWRVELAPQTLAIRVIPTNQPAVQASIGVRAHNVSALQQTATQADWEWDDGAYRLRATLDQGELAFSITAREAGELHLIQQPGSAMGKGLIWPLAEGHYVPAGNERWQSFLLDQGDVNTTQDLSLPLWGMDHGAFTLNWLMTNPFNNRLQLQWTAEGRRLALAASHEFTSLEPGTPMTFSLYLGDSDLLAGAKRYRRWLVDSGRYEPLADKLRKLPEGEKLLGASHVYLWGNELLGLKDVRDWSALRAELQGDQPLAVALRVVLDKASTQVLRGAGPTLNRYEQTTLLRGLNAALDSKERQQWQARSEPDMVVLAGAYGALRAEVARVFASALTDTPALWGSTLTPDTFKQLQNAGLSRLLLTLGEGWEGGLWHPETVRAGVAAGYLVAPYDSYETALSASENPGWTTAHLGSKAFENCAIVLKNGTSKSGFQQSGHYTDPRCVRPLMEARVEAVRNKAGFNAWFLDAYATSMLFDSYRPGATLTQAQNAEGNIDASRWIADIKQLPSGSEDGNAVTARGILFAHGMQTPVIGWGDPQMSKDKQSPYYVGAWYPEEQPAVFFKPVPLREPYRTVHFDPSMRLPLYQAVFHGSVITSHHWLFDNLKLKNVRVENELTQLLYNVPPLYHLSASTLVQRIPLISRQDAFFRPLHQRLATQAMTDFRWLSADRQLQQTTFADGTRLVANFSVHPQSYQGQAYVGQSITAYERNDAVSVYHVKPER